MSKNKLNLSSLKVKSFVTDLKNDHSETIKGGGGFLSIFGCNSCGGTCDCSNGCRGNGGTSSGTETCQNTV